MAIAQIDPDIIAVDPVDPFLDPFILDIPGIPIPDIPIKLNFDYGDAPDNPDVIPSYPTLHSSNGARHLVSVLADGFVLKLGPNIDTELDGQPTALASGDDSMGPYDDEDGVIFLTPLQPGLSAGIEVEASGQGRLDVWVDFNLNGSWLDSGEQIFVSEPLAAGINPLNFTVPAAAIPGKTFIRFRFSSQGGLLPTDTAKDGEVEDYIVKIEEGPNPNPTDEADWGDARKDYPVLYLNSGAHHFLTTELMLGSAVDSEPDGQPSINADRDDMDFPVDDEDGITFTSSISTGAIATIVAVSTMPGRLDAWIDFNQDGDWTDFGEQILVSTPVVGGPNNLNFLVPASASTGGTYARFRLSSGGSLSPEGAAPDGEVEDYHIGIEQGTIIIDGFDWGDAPDDPTSLQVDYPTLASSGGARHFIGNGAYYLGATVDPEPNGQPHPLALGDDNDGSDDEDGVIFFSSQLQQSSMAQIQIQASTTGYINAWIDFDQDGDWNDFGSEKIILNSVVVAGPNLLSFTVPSSAAVGPTFARIRFNSTGNLGPTDPVPNAFAQDGEVEDYYIRITEDPNGDHLDWGDARDPSFPTLDASNGASHLIDELFLGESVDSEPDGQPSVWALGDDNDGNDDEDGIIFLTPIISGSIALVRVLPTMTGILDAWIDFDGDGTWTQPNNRIFNNQTVNPGQVLAFKVPKVKKPLKATGRFRLSHGGSDYEGHEIGGEVEDYLLKIWKLIKWELNPDLLQDQIIVTWLKERGMTYDVQSSMTPQEWIIENVGEEEVARADDLFPSGLAWSSVLGGHDHGDDIEQDVGPCGRECSNFCGWCGAHFCTGEPCNDDDHGDFGVDEHEDDDAGIAGDPDGDPSEGMYRDRGKSSPKIAHGIRIDRSKKVVLFRVIAAPE